MIVILLAVKIIKTEVLICFIIFDSI